MELFKSIGLLNVDAKNYQTTGCPTEKGDEVLGNLTELEKACQVFLAKSEEKHKLLHDQIEKLSGQDSAELSKVQYEHHLLHITVETVRNMMWMSISERFPKVGEKTKNGSAFAIRNGNKVVLTAPKRTVPGDFFSKMMGGGGITIIEMGVMKF